MFLTLCGLCCSSFSQKVTLGAPVRLQARSFAGCLRYQLFAIMLPSSFNVPCAQTSVARSDDVRRWKFEIEWNGKHIGWLSSYCTDENYEWVGKIKDGQTVYRAIGIDICEPNLWGKGIGTNAFRAFMNYYFENGVDELYTRTWSGNVRMLRCAEKLGFVERNREIDFREVNGQKYDGLTIRLEK